MDLLRPDATTRAAINNLHQVLHGVRQIIGGKSIGLRDDVVQLCPAGGLTVEVDRFEQAAAKARSGSDVAALRSALELWAAPAATRRPVRRVDDPASRTFDRDSRCFGDRPRIEARRVERFASSPHDLGTAQNSELFWAVRVGIAANLELALQEVGPMVLGGVVFYPGEQAAAMVSGWRDHVNQVPDELSTIVNLTTAPPVPFIPEEWHYKRYQ